MPSKRFFIVVLAVVAGLVVTGLVAGIEPSKTPQASEPKRPPIPLAELRERGVEGRLGVSLGKIVEVVENRSNAKIDADEPFFLRIDTVNGKSLETPQLYSSSTMPLVREVDGLKVGDKFRCIGYETGGYRGSPPGEFDYMPAYATVGYHFLVKFAVVKVITPKGKTP